MDRINEVLRQYNQTEIKNIKDIHNLDTIVVKTLYDDRKVLDLKVLDPAVGSGHFLLSAQQILLKLHKIFLDKLERKCKIHKLKEKIIRDNLFGVDLKPSAVEICKLRLYLSLTEEVKNSKDIEPLVNIRYNIFCGNSLIGFVKNKRVNTLSEHIPIEIQQWTNQLNGYYPEKANEIIDLCKEPNTENLVKLKDKLIEIYKNEKDSEKAKFLEHLIEDVVHNKLKNRIDNLYLSYVNGLLNRFNNELEFSDLRDLNPFHWVMEFSELFDNGGFDIVIGNPPYGNILSNLEKQIIEKTYLYKTIKTDNTGKGSNNTASLFIERALGFLKQNCKLGFIVPNSILRIPQFNKIRKVILENYYVFKIRDEGFPYVGVNLEMVTILLSNEKRKQYFIKCESSKVSDKCAVSANSALSLGYIPLYYDNIFDYLLNLKNAKYGILHAIQGKPRKADYVKKGIQCISSKVIDPYVLKMEKDKHRIVPNTFKYIDEEYEKNLLITPYFFGSDLSSLKKDVIEATIKPKGYITDGNGVLLICKENLIKPLCVILNSKLINHIIKKYVLNYSIRDITIREDTLLKVPFIIPHNKKYITTLSNILLFTNQYYYNNFLSNNKENQELKEQIKLFNELANYLIYELYFKDKFKKDKTPTNLLNLIKAKLKDVNYDDWIKLEFKEREILSKKEREDKEKLELKNLKIIKTVYNKISKDNKVNKEIEKIKSNEWVKVIDEKY